MYFMVSIGQAAIRSGVTIETIRYYEREGIVPKPGRTAAGRRTYTNEEIAKLRFVKRCRDLGLAIPAAKSLLGLAQGSPSNCTSAQKIAQKHLTTVRAKIKLLREMEAALTAMIKQCERSGEQCPILDQLLTE